MEAKKNLLFSNIKSALKVLIVGSLVVFAFGFTFNPLVLNAATASELQVQINAQQAEINKTVEQNGKYIFDTTLTLAGSDATRNSGVDTSTTPTTYKISGGYGGGLSYYGTQIQKVVGGKTAAEVEQNLNKDPSKIPPSDLEIIRKQSELQHKLAYLKTLQKAVGDGKTSELQQSGVGIFGQNDPKAVELNNQIDTAQKKEAELKKATEKPDEVYCYRSSGLSFDFSLLGCAAMGAYYVLLQVAGWVLFLAAIFFNYTLDLTLNMTSFITKVNIVDLGWTTFRDITLLFFVFIILYIAISTIIGNSTYGIKSLLMKVIVAAILINFSLFFTKVIVDTSNIFALQFYTKIMQGTAKSQAGAPSDRTGIDNPLSHYDSGISAAFADAMGLQQIWGKQGSEVDGVEKEGGHGLNAANLLMVGIGGAFFMMITAAVFVAGAIMMLIRTLVMVFLMVLSPLAFMGNILPATKSHASKWWDALFKNAIYAPVYMMLMYVVISMVVMPNYQKTGAKTFLDLFRGEHGALDVFVTFVLLNALMLGCIVVANKLGAAGAGVATSFAGKATFGLAGWTGRQTIGRAADRIAETDFMKNRTSFAGRSLLRGLRSVEGSSFDARTIKPLGKQLGLGDGTAGGFKKAREDATKSKTEFGKSLESAGQRAYARDLKSRFGRSNKKASEEVMKAALTDEITKHSEQIRELEDNPDNKELERLLQKEKSNNLKPGEQARLTQLEGTVGTATVKKYQEFNESTGTWDKKEDQAFFDPATRKTVLENMKKSRSQAQSYLRNKKWKS